MSEFLALDLAELRRRMADHQSTRPTDLFGADMQIWLKTKGSITFAIELKEAEAKQQPFYITVPPLPIERPVQPLLRLRKAKEPTHPAPEEATMPQSNPTHHRSTHHRSPQTRIEHLLERIQAATRKGEKLYWAQQEIRDLCKAHGLEVPPEAQKRERGTSKQDAPPHQLRGAPASEASMRPKREAQVIDRGGHTTPLKDLGKLTPPPFEGYTWFREMDRRLLDNLSHFRNSERKPEEWSQIARDLAILETTAGAARQIAERHAEAV